MAKITLARPYDIDRQFCLADWTAATVSATRTSVTLSLGTERLVLSGSFTLAGTMPSGGTVTGLSFTTGGATPLSQFSVSGLALDFDAFQNAMADGDMELLLGGSDQLVGTAQADRLSGHAGNDRLEGLGGNDTLIGGQGNDLLDGGTGNDLMQGGSGNDVYVVDSSTDKVVELAGGGVDTVRTSLAQYALSINVENLQALNAANFTGTGNALDNLIAGNRGNDSLTGLDGRDTLYGGQGNDTLDGGNGNDRLIGDAGGAAVTSSAAATPVGAGARPIGLTLTLPEVAATSSTTVTGFVNDLGLSHGSVNVALLVDLSGYTTFPSTGHPVGDLNGDGVPNQKGDALVQALNTLVASLKDMGVANNVRVSLIPTQGGAQVQAAGLLNADANGNGVADLIDAAKALGEQSYYYYPSYQDSLTRAVEFFKSSPEGDNLMFIASSNASGSMDVQSSVLNTLRDPNGLDVTIRSIGLNTGSGGSTYTNSSLDLLDDGLANNSIISVDSADSLAAGMLSSRVHAQDVKRIEIYKNGVLATTLAPSKLVETPFGLKYSATVNGLSSTGSDQVEARLVLNDAASTAISTSQQISVGKLLSNDRLVGGAGNDTLDGGAGTDTLIGGAGDDTYHIESAGKVVQELANQGNDTVETTLTYSLNNAAHQNIENLKLLGYSNLDGTGNANNNRIEGNIGNNVLNGLGGNDTLVGGAGFDIANYADATSAVYVSLMSSISTATSTGTATGTGKADQLSGIEGIWGSRYADSFYGDNADNVFRGNGGDDTLYGGGGFNTADYSAATSAMSVVFDFYPFTGMPGYDYYSNYGRATSADGSEGTDYLNAYDMQGVVGSAYDDLISDRTNLYIANRFDGGSGNDTLEGGSGNDTLIGGAGKDQLTGGDGTDTVDYAYAAAAVSGSLLTGQFAVGTNGLDADTLSGIEAVIGSRFADAITGGDGHDSLQGGSGNDTLEGGNGNDTLDGGSGDDRLVGGDGDDVYNVDSLNDVVVEAANGGRDTLNLNITAGTVNWALGDIEVAWLKGGAHYNVTGSAAGDEIHGGSGNDTINGGTGSDADTLYGGAGTDWVSYADHLTGVSGTLDSYFGLIDGDRTNGFENFLGSTFADSVTGGYEDNVMDGGAGDDTLNGDSGNDTLIGGAGDDLLNGGWGADTVSYAHLNTAITVDLATGKVVTQTEGTDTLQEIENIIGSSAGDSMTGTNASPGYWSLGMGFMLDGGAGNDTLTGSIYADTLIGGEGDDVLDGGASSVYYYYSSNDTVDYSGAAAAVTVNLGMGAATGGAGSDTLSGFETVVGSRHADSLTGSSTQSDTLVGGAGADMLDGGIDQFRDIFRYTSVADSASTGFDTILSFGSSGYSSDQIDLSAIDANANSAYYMDDSFSFIGNATFSGKAGELRFEQTATDTFVYGDVDGDASADLAIKIAGVQALTTANFWL